jgi:hypothetical protein
MTGMPLFVGPSFAGFAQIVRDRWIVSVSGHLEPEMFTTAPAPASHRYSSFGLAVGAGRKFGGEDLDVDVTVGIGLLMQRQEARVTEVDTRARLTDPRVFASVRLSDPSAPLRAYVGVEIDAWAPPGADDAPPPQLVSWPYWSLSFAFGVRWEAK